MGGKCDTESLKYPISLFERLWKGGGLQTVDQNIDPEKMKHHQSPPGKLISYLKDDPWLHPGPVHHHRAGDPCLLPHKGACAEGHSRQAGLVAHRAVGSDDGVLYLDETYLQIHSEPCAGSGLYTLLRLQK